MPDAVDIPREASTDFQFGALTNSLGFLLRLSQLVSFREYFDNLRHLDVRPGEISVLMLIGDNPGIRQGALAKRLLIKRAHMTKMMHAMEQAQLVTRSVPEDDKRSVALWLTDKGAARVDAVREPFLAHEARPIGNLTAREAADLKHLLRKYLHLPEPDGDR